jgi:hypothetical protein
LPRIRRDEVPLLAADFLQQAKLTRMQDLDTAGIGI